MHRYVDQHILSGVSWTVLRGRDIVDQQCVGFADRETRTALRPDHIFRAFSNTKLIVSCAMMLVEQGRIGLDDKVKEFLPQLANRKVLKAGATSLADVEPARSSITIRSFSPTRARAPRVLATPHCSTPSRCCSRPMTR
jgi:CubicO group peptidase (beta-lactamase class C family)